MSASGPQSDRPRAWQRMLSGRRLDLLAPSPDDIAIEDIAHGLARVARWNGQTYGANTFSVAEHTVLMILAYYKFFRWSWSGEGWVDAVVTHP